MNKKLFIIAIISTVVTSAYAAEGKGYREYGETYHSTPGANFHIEEMAPGTFDTLFKKKGMSPESASSSTRVPNKSGHINEYLAVDGYHKFSISNNTHYRQTYEISVSLNCDHMNSYFTRHVDVEPGGYYNREDHSYGTVQESSSGNYRIEGASRISGESSDSSRDSGTLSVSR